MFTCGSADLNIPYSIRNPVSKRCAVTNLINVQPESHISISAISLPLLQCTKGSSVSDSVPEQTSWQVQR